jgi:hypothetical protein
MVRWWGGGIGFFFTTPDHLHTPVILAALESEYNSALTNQSFQSNCGPD